MEAILALILQITGPDYRIMKKIAFCESSYRVLARSKTNDFGLFQINLKAHYKNIPGNTPENKVAWLYVPENNIKFAYALFKKQGTKPWKYSKHCWGK